MRFTQFIPAAVLIASAVANPVRQLQDTDYVHSTTKRQLGGLGSILQLVKGIMDKGSPGSSGITPSTTGITSTGTTASASVIALQQCSDAIAKIESALAMSESYMKAAGGMPTTKDIQAVLIVIEQSLGAECGNENTVSRDFTNAGALSSRQLPTSTCSACERQLYHIVQQLQAIFALGANIPDIGGLSSSIALLPTSSLNVPVAQLTNLPALTSVLPLPASEITSLPAANQTGRF